MDDFNVLIVRLSPFRDVVKSITHQFLYGECRRFLDDSNIDFAFFPTESERRHHVELKGIRSKKSACEFDVIFISNSFTSEIINLPYMLKLAGLPYSSVERAEKNTKPLILMGGSNALASQSVMFSEDNAFVDALFFGEGEKIMSKILEELASVPLDKRREKLKSLHGNISGLKVFGAKGKIEKAIYHNVSDEALASAPQFLFDSSEATSARLFIAYDCPSFCTFCFEGWERKPYREVPKDVLLKAAANLRKQTGADKLEITAFNFNTHTDVTSLFKELNKMYFQVNFMSQRADILAANPSLVSFEVASGKRQYTVGVEGVSERMRSYFNKNLSEEVALKAITLLLKEPIREIKLFYIISGLETEEDTEDFKQFLAKIGKLKELYNNGIRILCSFGLLVRMPFTPLRYEKLILSENEWKPVVEMIRKATESAGYEFRLTYDYKEYFFSQTLAMLPSGVYAAKTLQEMAEKGFLYDQTLTDGAYDFFSERVKLDDSFSAEKAEDYNFAFSDIDTHTSPKFLYRKFKEAQQGIQTPMCLGSGCNACGACGKAERQFLENHVIKMPDTRDKDEIMSLVKAKAQAKPVYIEFDIAENMKFSREETRTASVMRDIFSKIDDGIHLVMTVRDVLFDGKLFENKLPKWYGKTLYAVYPFSNEQRSKLLSLLKACGYVVYDSEVIPSMISARLTQKEVDVAELEKYASGILDSMHIPYSLSRKDGKTYYAIAPKALKKKVVTSCKIEDGAICISGSVKLDFSCIRKNGFISQLAFKI